MAKDDLLFKLIRNLNKNEKRYFSLFANLEQKRKDYLVLYGLINKHINTDKLPASKMLSEVKGIGNLSRSKKQLYEQLMCALRLKYEQVFAEEKMNQLIFEAKLLRKKGLAVQSNACLAAAKKKARHYECHYQVCRIIDEQVKLAMNSLDKHMLASVLSLHEEKERTLELIKDLDQFEKYRHQALLYYRRDSSIRTEEMGTQVATLLETLLSTQHQASTFFARTSCLDALAILYRLQSDNAVAKHYYQKILSLWESPEYAHLRDAHIDLYKLHVYNYLNALHSSGQYEVFDALLDQISQWQPRFLDEEIEDFQGIEFLRFLKAINTGAYQDARQQIPEIEARWSFYEDRVEQMVESRKITWMYNIAVFYFLTEYFAEAESWFLKLLHLSFSKEQRTDLKYLSRLFLLVLHYENGRHDNSELKHLSTHRYLERTATFLKFEKNMVRLLLKLSKAVQHTEKRSVLLDIEKYIAQHKKNNTLRNGLEELELWVTSRLQGKTMVELLNN